MEFLERFLKRVQIMKYLSSKFVDEKLILAAEENFCDGYNLIFKGKISIFLSKLFRKYFSRNVYLDA